jgi:hypothetical protein
MTASSLEELKDRILAGRYTVSSADLADEIVAKFALVRRVSRQLRDDERERAGRPSVDRARPHRSPSAPWRSRVS